MRIASKKILRHAKGQLCTLRLEGCNHNPETTIAAHIRDHAKGMGTKANDYSIIFCCSSCHSNLDENRHGLGLGIYKEILRAWQETLAILIADNIILISLDLSKPKAIKPRKPKAQRAKIASRGFSKNQRGWGR